MNPKKTPRTPMPAASTGVEGESVVPGSVRVHVADVPHGAALRGRPKPRWMPTESPSSVRMMVAVAVGVTGAGGPAADDAGGGTAHHEGDERATKGEQSKAAKGHGGKINP
jgi:hypothetical protein